jgi:hypothetical protein
LNDQVRAHSVHVQQKPERKVTRVRCVDNTVRKKGGNLKSVSERSYGMK